MENAGLLSIAFRGCPLDKLRGRFILGFFPVFSVCVAVQRHNSMLGLAYSCRDPPELGIPLWNDDLEPVGLSPLPRHGQDSRVSVGGCPRRRAQRETPAAQRPDP